MFFLIETIFSYSDDYQIMFFFPSFMYLSIRKLEMYIKDIDEKSRSNGAGQR